MVKISGEYSHENTGVNQRLPFSWISTPFSKFLKFHGHVHLELTLGYMAVRGW
jgi:hypothetical protein